jgi:hypothetical protein
MPTRRITFKLILIFASLVGGLSMFGLRKRIATVGEEDTAYRKIKRKTEYLLFTGLVFAVVCMRFKQSVYLRRDMRNWKFPSWHPEQSCSGLDVSTSVAVSWIAMAILIIAAIIIRLFVITKI